MCWLLWTYLPFVLAITDSDMLTTYDPTLLVDCPAPSATEGSGVKTPPPHRLSETGLAKQSQRCKRGERQRHIY